MNRLTAIMFASIMCCLMACAVGTDAPDKKATKVVTNSKPVHKGDEPEVTLKNEIRTNSLVVDELAPFLAKHGAPDGVESNEREDLSSDETTRALVYEKANVAVVFIPQYDPPRKPPFGRWVIDCYRDSESQALIEKSDAERRLLGARNSTDLKDRENPKVTKQVGKPILVPGKKLDDDAYKHFIALYGQPNSQGTTDKDIPKPAVITKWMICKSEGVKIVLRPAAGNDAAKPISMWKWDFSRFAYLDGITIREDSAVTRLAPRASYVVELPERIADEPKTVANLKPPTMQPQWHPIPVGAPGMVPPSHSGVFGPINIRTPVFSGVGGPVNVRGHYRANGTYVQPYTRRLPR